MPPFWSKLNYFRLFFKYQHKVGLDKMQTSSNPRDYTNWTSWVLDEQSYLAPTRYWTNCPKLSERNFQIWTLITITFLLFYLSEYWICTIYCILRSLNGSRICKWSKIIFRDECVMKIFQNNPYIPIPEKFKK